ncbi:MAG: cation transporting ATPase C-terminal domain-containing protein [Promethearchaeota archaeon]
MVNYYPNEFNAYEDMFSVLISTIIFSILVILSFRRYHEKRTKLSLYLFLGQICYFMTFLSLFISYLGWYQSYYYKNDVYRVGFVMAYSFLQISNVFLLMFSEEIFFQISSKPKKFALTVGFLVLSIILIVLLCDIPANNIGEYQGTRELPLRRVLVQLGIGLSTLILCFLMIIRFTLVRRRIDEPGDRRSIMFIILYYSLIVLALMFVVLDGIFNKGQPTIFLIIMHLSCDFAGIFIYLGFLARKKK